MDTNLCQTDTAGDFNDWFCSICHKSGHTAQHHKDFPDIYGKITTPKHLRD